MNELSRSYILNIYCKLPQENKIDVGRVKVVKFRGLIESAELVESISSLLLTPS